MVGACSSAFLVVFGAIALHVKIAMRTALFPPSFRKTFSARASRPFRRCGALQLLRIAPRELLHERCEHIATPVGYGEPVHARSACVRDVDPAYGAESRRWQARSIRPHEDRKSV